MYAQAICTYVTSVFFKSENTNKRAPWGRDANFDGLPVVTTENCKKFQFATDYGKFEFSYGN